MTHQAPPTPPRPHEGEGAFHVVMEECEDVYLTKNFSDSDSDEGSENIPNTKDYVKHNKSDDNIHKNNDICIPPLLDDVNGRTHPPTSTTRGSVPTEGEDMEIANEMITSGDDGVGEHMSGRQETHLPDESATGYPLTKHTRQYTKDMGLSGRTVWVYVRTLSYQTRT